VIARFGRSLNFGKANPIPIWSRGDANVFPSGIGWADLLSGQGPPTFTYGVPFLDFIALISTTSGFESHINTFTTIRSRVTPFIEKVSKMASSFISRSSQ